MTMNPTRRGFLIRTAAVGWAFLGRGVSALLPVGRQNSSTDSIHSGQSAVTHGPFLGHLTSTSAMVWARCSTPGIYRLTARGIGGDLVATAEAAPENDRCVVWQLTGLQAERRYSYEVSYQDQPVLRDENAFFVTPPVDDAPRVTRLAIGSCARETAESAAVWRRMSALDPHVTVLLGDTPYIDSMALDVQRTRYAEFAAVPDFASLLRNCPLYATWDDHDFGLNDSSDGRFLGDGERAGKDNARQAFIEYHANPSYGEGNQGVYTKFRQGGVEVFLLDTRYFAGTEPSPVAVGQPTLLGTRQWEWLQRELQASTAPFKLLASGMVWNGAVRPGKLDCWETYSWEREALFNFIGQERIPGVVLVGGDVHRTRILRYDTTDTAGYPLTELVTSPIHESVIDAANAPHPALIHDSGEPHAFLLLTVDTTVTPATLMAQFQNAAGRELYSMTLSAAELSAA